MSTATHKGKQLRSTVTDDGKLVLSLAEQEFPLPEAGQVLVKVEASPINPSDIALLLAAADPQKLKQTGTSDAPRLEGEIPAAAMPMLKARIGKSMPVGGEAAGLVVAAGAGAEDLLGKRISAAGGSATYSEYQYADCRMALTLPDSATAADGASGFVNPMTSQAMLDVMKSGGYTGLIHTAAASNLGQMLVRLCLADDIPLINIVRKKEHETLLSGLGAKYVINQSEEDFIDKLTAAIDETGIMLAFDAVGGGDLAGNVLYAMERSASKQMPEYSRYGSDTFKQLYIYGGLALGPITVPRALGLCWGMNGFLLTHFLAKADAETVARMRTRIKEELTTTFKTHYTAEISLVEALDLETCRAYAARRTGEKYLINPSKG